MSVCPVRMGKNALRIRLTDASVLMANQLAAKWPMLNPNRINQLAIEKGLHQMMSMPTLLSPKLAAQFRRVA